ncbi:hypothetical protein [Erythrobacter sp. R86502]|uniref:hypothetical protein n=1 Tax=Erythrobacter sp. R86502 TaxID=3093846 RepID=UPI0036D287D0
MTDLIDLLNTYRTFAQHLISIVLAIAIWRWGGGPERWLIGIFLTTMMLPMYVAWALDLGAVESGPYAPAIFMLDVLAAVLYVAIALHANRNYPMWIAGFQVVSVVAHLVKALVAGVSPLAFAILVIGPSYGALVVLLIGFVRHRVRENRFGPYREWRLTSPNLGWLRF